MISLRSFLKWAKKAGLECVDPTSIDLIRQSGRMVTFLETEEVVRLFQTPDLTTIQGLRDHAIMQTIYASGLRISELTALNRESINLANREFAVRGKGKKIRSVFLTPIAVETIESYLKARNDTFAPLFIRHNWKTENIHSSELTNDTVRLTRFFIT